MQSADQTIDDAGTVLRGGRSQLCVACGRCGAGMSQQRLDMEQAQSLFEQVGGKRMAQGVNGGFFLMPQSASIFFMAV